MPESGPLGSERGAASNGRPYRETSDDASKPHNVTSKPESCICSWEKAWRATYLLAMWCPV